MLAKKHLQILLLFTITSLKWGRSKKKNEPGVTVYKIKSSQLYYIALYTILIVSKQLYRVKQENSLSIMQVIFPVKVSSLVIQCWHHPVQLSSNNVCAISQASPKKQAKDESGKDPKHHWWQKLGRKTLGETMLSQGAFLLWPDENSMVWFNSRLQHRSDWAEDMSGSRGLVSMAKEVFGEDLSLELIYLMWSLLKFRAVEVVFRCWSTIWSGYRLDLSSYGDLWIRMKQTNIV